VEKLLLLLGLALSAVEAAGGEESDIYISWDYGAVIGLHLEHISTLVS